VVTGGIRVELIKVEIKRVIGPTPSGAAVLLGNESRTFVVFVGYYEAAALLREMNGEPPPRPLTHELIQNIFLGFDIKIRSIVISSIIDNTFCATLVLEQPVADAGGEWVGRRNEVRIDARPSDCLVLALKNKVDILVSEEVFSQVQDVSKMTADVESNLGGISPAEFEIPTEGPEESRGLAEEDEEFDEDDFEFPPDDDDEEDEDDEDDEEDEDDETRESEDEDETTGGYR
jgi:bifunctional DNase/RNase